MADNKSKRCTCCEQHKPLSDFPYDKRASDGRQSACRECTRERARSYYAANRERTLARARELRLSNLEYHRARARANSRKHSAKNTARATAWIKANRDRFRANMKACEARRRSAERTGASGPETRAWFNAQKKVCHWCSKNCAADAVIDHRTPLARGGKHETRNLVVACRSCNARKCARDPIEWAQSIGKLL